MSNNKLTKYVCPKGGWLVVPVNANGRVYSGTKFNFRVFPLRATVQYNGVQYLLVPKTYTPVIFAEDISVANAPANAVSDGTEGYVNIDGINFEGQFWINVGDKPQVKNGQQWKLRLYDLSGKPATLPGPRSVELIGVHYAFQQTGQTCAEFHVLSPITTPYTMDLYGGAVPAIQRRLPTSCTDPVSRHDQPYSKVLNRFVEGQSPGCAFASPIVWTNTLGALCPDIKVKMRIRENNSQTASQWQTATFTGYRSGQLAPSSYYTALGMKDGKSSLFLAAPAALSCTGEALATWQFPLSSGGSYLLDVDASAFGGPLAFKYAMPNTLSPSFLNERPLPAPDPVVISDETLLILLGVGVAAFVLYRLL